MGGASTLTCGNLPSSRPARIGFSCHSSRWSDMREAISVKRTRVVLAGCVATVFLTGSLVGCGGLTASPDIPDGGTAAQSSSSGGSQATAYPIACPVYGDLTACGQSDPPAYVIVEHASSADGGPWREPGGRVDDCE